MNFDSHLGCGTVTTSGRVGDYMTTAPGRLACALALVAPLLMLGACSSEQEKKPQKPDQPERVTVESLGVSIELPPGEKLTETVIKPGCDDGTEVPGVTAMSGGVALYAVPDGCVFEKNESFNGKHLLLADPVVGEDTHTIVFTGGSALTQEIAYDEYTNSKTSYTDRFAFVFMEDPAAGKPAKFTVVVLRDELPASEFRDLVESIQRAG